MYKIDNSLKALAKFSKFITEYLTELRKKAKSINYNITSLEDLETLKTNADINELLAHQSYLLSIDASLELAFETIRYFKSEDCLDIEQVSVALNQILNNENLAKTGEKIRALTHNLNSVNSAIIRCENYLNETAIDYTYMIELLESSPLSEEEKAEVLASFAYAVSPQKVVVKAEEKDQALDMELPPLEDITEVADVTYSPEYIEEQKEKSKVVLESATDFITKHYGLIETRSAQELKYATIMGEIVAQDDNVNKYEYKEEYLISIVTKLLKLKQTLSEAWQEKDVDYETIELSIALIDELLEKGQVAEEILQNIAVETELSTPNIVFLLAEDGTPLFNTEFDQGDKTTITKMVDRMFLSDNSALTRARQIKGLDDVPYTFFVKTVSKMCCAYTNITNDTALVVALSSINDIFDMTKNNVHKYLNRIGEIKELVQDNDQDFIQTQAAFADTLGLKEGGSAR